MSPKGDVDSRWSIPQPIAAPTRTPATNSEESRKPSAMAEALAAPSSPSPAGWLVPSLRLSRSSDNRWSRLPSLAESAASSGDLSRLPFPLLSVRSAMLETRHDVTGNRNYAPSPLKAARTILTVLSRVKIPCSMLTSLIQMDFCRPSGEASTAAGASQRCGAILGRLWARQRPNPRFGVAAVAACGPHREIAANRRSRPFKGKQPWPPGLLGCWGNESC